MAFSTREGKTQTTLAEINMIPFIDIVLVLLIIFMVTAPVIQSGIEVNVPKTQTVREIAEEKLMVSVDKAQTIYLQNAPVNINELGAKIRESRWRRRSDERSESKPEKALALFPSLRWCKEGNGGPMTTESEKLDRWLVMSVALHGLLFTALIFAPGIFPGESVPWGSATGGSGGIDVKIVGSISGVPLPQPEVVEENAAANESPGFYKSEEAAAPPPDKAELIPETKTPVQTTAPKPVRPAPPASKSAAAPAAPPSNAVPFGEGGKPALAYGQFSTGAGAAGIGFGDGTFGGKYAYYVDAMTRRISQNWLQSLVDSRVQRAQRVYLSFEIARDGAIRGLEIKQSSGIPSLDRSAQRAIYASSPLQPLPADYRGGNVEVTFYFEYSR
ncbi:MAG: TonB family protein [Acidobacteria bacterium]|nr:TonB family protein [Acidobacteriota bacterium]